MHGIKWPALLLLLLGLSGCFLTKVATVPMRVGGAVASVVPVVGNPIHDAIDTAADAVDTLPFLMAAQENSDVDRPSAVAARSPRQRFLIAEESPTRTTIRQCGSPYHARCPSSNGTATRPTHIGGDPSWTDGIDQNACPL